MGNIGANLPPIIDMVSLALKMLWTEEPHELPVVEPYKEFETLQFDRPLDGVLRITLNKLDTLNSFSADMHGELVRV